VEGREPPLDLLGEDGPVTRGRVALAKLTRLTGPTRLLTGLLVALLTVALAGCSGDRPSGSPSDGGTSTSSGTSTGSTGSTAATPSESSPARSAAAAPPAPRNDACYRLTPRDLTSPTSSKPPVPCTRSHNARTIHVGRLDLVVDGHAVAVDSRHVQRQLATTCPRRLAAYLGGSPATRRLSRLHVVWYSPTLAESDAGADWFRCDVVAFADEERLFPLPRKGRLRGLLDRDGALDTFGLCGSTAPGARGFERVICARRHAWQAIDAIPLAGGRRYPGVATVRRAGDTACKDRARERSEDTLRFRYGWEWPTAQQWARGQHYGFCWAPS
jgi:hypothetical protein